MNNWFIGKNVIFRGLVGNFITFYDTKIKVLLSVVQLALLANNYKGYFSILSN